MPYSGDLWYTADIAFAQKALPQGVTIYISSQYGNDQDDVSERLFGRHTIVQNYSTTPLYVFNPNITETSSSQILQSNNIVVGEYTAYKIYDNKVFATMNRVSKASIESQNIKWEDLTSVWKDPIDSRSYQIHSYHIQTYGDPPTYHGLKLRAHVLQNLTSIKLPIKFEDNKPIDAPLTQNTESKLSMRYDGKDYDAPFTITYSHNPTYRKDSIAEDSCYKSVQNQRKYPLGYYVFGTAGIVGAGILLTTGIIVYIKKVKKI